MTTWFYSIVNTQASSYWCTIVRFRDNLRLSEHLYYPGSRMFPSGELAHRSELNCDQIDQGDNAADAHQSDRCRYVCVFGTGEDWIVARDLIGRLQTLARAAILIQTVRNRKDRRQRKLH
ncbi:MAG: hypothetical protein O2856_01870 [Planctomycetota bacterium]|nr:hypothetical protein [Planctomycetota bacterium]